MAKDLQEDMDSTIGKHITSKRQTCQYDGESRGSDNVAAGLSWGVLCDRTATWQLAGASPTVQGIL